MTVLDFRIEPDVSNVRYLRMDVRDRLEGLAVAENDVDRLVLVIDEIVNNAIEHGSAYRRDGDVLEIRLEVGESALVVEFHDPTVPPETVAEIARLIARSRAGLPPPDSERGRGLFLIGDGLDDISIQPGANGIGLNLRGRLLRETA